MTERLVGKPIGIIGLGDLGSRLATQELLAGNRLEQLLLAIKSSWDYSFNEHLLNISAEVPQPEYEL